MYVSVDIKRRERLDRSNRRYAHDVSRLNHVMEEKLEIHCRQSSERVQRILGTVASESESPALMRTVMWGPRGHMKRARLARYQRRYTPAHLPQDF
jgi:hypothetical protein